jgi:hypothetical protein
MLFWSTEKAPQICGSQHKFATQIRVARGFYGEFDNYERNNLYLNSKRTIKKIVIIESLLLEQLKFK